MPNRRYTALLFRAWHFAKFLFKKSQFPAYGLTIFLLFITGCDGSFQTLFRQASTANLPHPGDDTGDNQDVSPFHTRGTGGQKGELSGSYKDRDFRLYVPDSYDATQASPAIVAFHGAGDTYTNFFPFFVDTADWQTVAETARAILIVPAHQNSSRPSFLHVSPTGQLMEDETRFEAEEVLDLIYYGVGANYNIDTEEIYWMGFSEGATFTTFAAIFLSEVLRAVVPYAGGLNPYNSSAITRNVPIFFLTGTLDFGFRIISSAAQSWTNRGNITRREFPTEITHDFVALSDQVSSLEIWDWLTSIPVPEVHSTYERP